MNGKVYIVGAGPGDPELITLKGKRCIENSDVIIYDYLANPVLLKFASKNSEIIYVGKKGGHHTMPQNDINNLIIKKAKKGLTITRLKGGDPFIFGRGGEEAEELVNAGIKFEIVPGITSAIAVPAYAGIPLTHRNFTSTLAFITGHEDPEKENSNIDWDYISKGIGTIVFLMGVKNLGFITEQLIKNGRSKDTPVALVQWGTTPKQLTVSGNLDNITQKVKEAGLKPPCIIIVGEVINLRDKLKWFENKPLFGKRILVTRATEQASDLVNILSNFGAECIEFPTIKIVTCEDKSLLDNAIDTIKDYEWLVFTSVNGVNFFFDRLFENGKDVRALYNIKTASIGPATSKRLFDFGIKSDIIPESYRAESIIDAFKNIDVKGKKILLPRAKEARPILPIELSKMGASVNEVIAYCTEIATEDNTELLKKLESKEIDIVTFTSSSTVNNFKALLPSEDFSYLMEGIKVASIGPVTSETALNLGFKVDITADIFTIEGLCDAILKFYD
ncbi:MAG: uroporphyrinogen-III C-methyltransferase [Desulfobacterales bacterium]|nr:uroporphyrinogen-III C-methyltransferase [Desulfobacterales bacterium]